MPHIPFPYGYEGARDYSASRAAARALLLAGILDKAGDFTEKESAMTRAIGVSNSEAVVRRRLVDSIVGAGRGPGVGPVAALSRSGREANT